jgi:hypothetical protein
LNEGHTVFVSLERARSFMEEHGSTFKLTPGKNSRSPSRSGEERWPGSLEYVEEQIRCLDDREIWGLRSSARKKLVEFTRERLRAQRAYQGVAPEEIVDLGEVSDPGWLTIGSRGDSQSTSVRTSSYHQPQFSPGSKARIMGS